jgi:hypothetical protein
MPESILAVLKAKGPMTNEELRKELGITGAACYQKLLIMLHDKKVEKTICMPHVFGLPGSLKPMKERDGGSDEGQ